MTVAIQFPQPLSRGRPTKFVPKPLSAPLFAGAASRHLEAGEALFVAGDTGDGCYRLEQGLLKVIITSPRERSGSWPSSAPARSSASSASSIGGRDRRRCSRSESAS